VTDWEPFARDLARQITHPTSRWRAAVEVTPRHVFVPAWWVRERDQWRRRDAEADLPGAYEDTSLVTRVGTLHADHAKPGDAAAARSTSSSTQPSLLLKMYRHALLDHHMDVLDVGTGSGYGTALLCHRLRDRHVTSIDIDPYLIQAADERLRDVGQRPILLTADVTTEPLPGTYDRIIASVALRPVPPGLVAALRPGGRLTAVISGIRAVLTADRLEDGRLYGRIEHATAGFMNTRTGADFEPAADRPDLDADGEDVGPGLYPLADPDGHWEIASMLGVTHPGLETRWRKPDEDGRAACLLWDVDGSWARAEGRPGDIPLVHQGGPQRLWTVLDNIKTRWLTDGGLPLYGAAVLVGLDGSVDLMRGNWRHKIEAA
jgi:protein-L-isoaspartate O-methyltransferase